ncbi:hypothetical protein FZEAL_7007 [Fusarium zealandicum]|uniref:CFEM domain-containing protein n=1 Tax=Fusarium zealandicum TaxID=1053134 RepID=A0A8H4UHD1_9HYPO|nr:hypothetical protein FZEAL_7007 [Fusarium zealandicum]
MKSFIFPAALFAGLVAAQSEQLPSCAQPCVTKFTTGDGIAGCSQLDIECICSNDGFLDEIACCLADACDAEGRADAVTFASQICSTAGVDVPDEVVCKAKSSTRLSTGSSTGSSTSTRTSTQTASSTSSADSDASNASDASSTTEEASNATGDSSTTASDASSETTTAATDSGASSANVAGLLGAAMAMLFAL